MADVSINTVSKLLVDAGIACAAYHDQYVAALKTKRVQVDEIWSFCYSKERNVARAKSAPEGAGDLAWALDALAPAAQLPRQRRVVAAEVARLVLLVGELHVRDFDRHGSNSGGGVGETDRFRQLRLDVAAQCCIAHRVAPIDQTFLQRIVEPL